MSESTRIGRRWALAACAALATCALGPPRWEARPARAGEVTQAPAPAAAPASAPADPRPDAAALWNYINASGREYWRWGTFPGTVPFFQAREMPHGDWVSVRVSPQARAAIEARLKPIEIDGVILDGKPTWVSGGKPAAQVAVKPGDTVVWKAASGTHGVVFDTRQAAEAAFQFDVDAELPTLGPVTVQGQDVWGTAPQPQGTVLARAVVRPDVAAGTALGFFCSQHGRAMSGALAFQKAEPFAMPAGSILVKANYPGGAEPPCVAGLMTLTVMYKPAASAIGPMDRLDADGWFWAMYSPTGYVQLLSTQPFLKTDPASRKYIGEVLSGSPKLCTDCHGRGNSVAGGLGDYVWRLAPFEVP